MKRLLGIVGSVGAIGAAAVVAAGSAHADPTCTFLGQNYNVTYDCLAPQPWLPYGTGNNPPLGGSAVTPSGGYHWQPKSSSCPACSS